MPMMQLNDHARTERATRAGYSLTGAVVEKCGD